MRFKDFVKEHIPVYSVSVALAIASVFFGLLPYYMVYRLLLRIVQGCNGRTVLWYALIILLSLAFEILMHCLSTALSHKTAFSILKKGAAFHYGKNDAYAARLHASKRERLLSQPLD